MANEDPEHIKRIRQRGCAVCGQTPSEAHHRTGAGMGRRSHDHEAIPLCTAHHRALHSGGEPFDTMGKAGRRAWEATMVKIYGPGEDDDTVF